MAILGIAVTLIWWSIRGSNDHSQSVDRIPEKVWEGGAATMTINVESSCPARLSITFSEEKDDGDGRHLEAWEKMKAGSHSWAINLPAHAGGYIDLTADSPEVGARMTWAIKINDRVIAEETQTLDEPLKAGYAFGLQTYMDDYPSASVD